MAACLSLHHLRNMQHTCCKGQDNPENGASYTLTKHGAASRQYQLLSQPAYTPPPAKIDTSRTMWPLVAAWRIAHADNAEGYPADATASGKDILKYQFSREAFTALTTTNIPLPMQTPE